MRLPPRHRPTLRQLIFWAICCDLGLVCKRLIAPAANLLTDAMRIPGGIATSFSLLFIVIGCEVMPFHYCGTLMGITQGLIMMVLGHTGSMGPLAIIGYSFPGFIVDLLMRLPLVGKLKRAERMAIMNASAAACAAITANIIVFRLTGLTLILYSSTALTAGTICGWASSGIADRIDHYLNKNR